RYHHVVPRHWMIGTIVIVLLVAAAVTLVVTRTPPRPVYPGQAPGAGSAAPASPRIATPPPLPGRPASGADGEAMLAQFAATISQGLYTLSNLLFLLSNSEAGLAVANQAGEPMTKALMRRMVTLFRQGPQMAAATCPDPPPQTP